MKLELPNNLDDLRIRHLKTITDEIEKKSNFDDINTRVAMVAKFSGKPVSEIEQVDMGDVNKVFKHIINLYASYKRKDPPKEITLAGQTYRLVQDVGKTMPSGWFIDIDSYKKRTAVEPEFIAAFCYIEKGMKYAQRNDVGSIMNPLEERSKIMAKHLPMPIFSDLTGFFLQKRNRLMPAYLAIVAARMDRAGSIGSGGSTSSQRNITANGKK